MLKLLPLVLVLPISAHAGGDNGSGMLISTSPEHMASSIFSGPDSQMPVTGEFNLAIEMPKRLRERPPRSIEEALGQMRRVLPHWYMSAMLQSQGEYECSVRVNGSSYSVLVGNWLWVQWGMDDESSELRRAFSGLGVNSSSLILQALNAGLCVDLKQGRKAALDEIARYQP